jgi:hypothetical protein
MTSRRTASRPVPNPPLALASFFSRATAQAFVQTDSPWIGGSPWIADARLFAAAARSGAVAGGDSYSSASQRRRVHAVWCSSSVAWPCWSSAARAR